MLREVNDEVEDVTRGQSDVDIINDDQVDVKDGSGNVEGSGKSTTEHLLRDIPNFPAVKARRSRRNSHRYSKVMSKTRVKMYSTM
jgi:hypothetical protein